MAKSVAVTPAKKGGGSLGPAVATAAKLVFLVGSTLLGVAFVHQEKTKRCQLRCNAAVTIARDTNLTDRAIAELARELPGVQNSDGGEPVTNVQ